VGADDRGSLVTLYRGMCESGRARGCTLLGDLFARGGSDAEAREIGPLLTRGCEGGDPDGCVRAARLLASGEHGTAPDPQKARTLLEEACRAERHDACAELGRLLELAVGGRRDVARARDLYESACEHRSGVGCHRLALTLRNARGHQDETRILELMRAACDSGAAEQACGSVAAAYDMGRGVSADRAQAVALYLRACDGGHADSCVRLAALVGAGDGAPADPARAAAYQTRACELAPNEERCETRVLAAPRSFIGRVTAGSGRGAPREGATCSVTIDRRMDPSACFVRVRCAGSDLYGEAGGWSSCELERAHVRADDLRTSPFDGTPQLLLDTEAGTLALADVGPRPRPLVVEMSVEEAPPEPGRPVRGSRRR
jgi:TPR repeat protein